MSWSYYIKDLPSVFFEENYPLILNQSSSGFVIEEFEKMLPFHKCTEEEYDQLATPAENAIYSLNQYKSNPEK